MPHAEIKIRQEPFHLLQEKAIYRPLQKQLILSDLHLDKTAPPSRNAPVDEQQDQLLRLQTLINVYQPDTVLVLGKLFQSERNSGWLMFKTLLLKNSQIQFVLVEAEHELLPQSTHIIENLLRVEQLEEQHLLISHQPTRHANKINICGLINPGLHYHHRGHESKDLPCFIFDTERLILPAFGNLAELHMIVRRGDAQYFVVDNAIVKEVS